MRLIEALLILCFVIACAHREVRENPDILDCINDQIALYDDLCAESSTGYEDMSGSEAHLEGVRCAVESINICREAR